MYNNIKLKRYIYIIVRLIFKKEEKKLEGIAYLNLYVKTLLSLRILSDSIHFESEPPGSDFNIRYINKILKIGDLITLIAILFFSDLITISLNLIIKKNIFIIINNISI